MAAAVGSRVMSAELPRAIIDSAHNAFISLDRDGRVREWNRRAEQLFGRHRAEAVGSELAELIVPARYRAAHREGLRRAFGSGATGPRLMHVSALRPDGSEFPADVTVVATGEGPGQCFHGWVQDVSERAELLSELTAQHQGPRPGFRAILDSLAEAITIRAAHDHIVYANQAALRTMGFSSLEEMQRRPPEAIFEEYEVYDEQGRPLSMADIPSVRMFSGEEPQPLVLRTVNRGSGEVRWQVLKASGMRDSEERLVATVTIIENVTREKTAELRERFLARASETLMSSLDLEVTLRNVAALTVPELADWCALDLVGERGEVERVALAHGREAGHELAERLVGSAPRTPDLSRGIGRVLSTGEPELYAEIDPEQLAAAAHNLAEAELLATIALRSLLRVPLRASGRILGVMSLATSSSLRRLTPEDLEFAQALAARAAVAVENSQLATARRQTASTLQRSLLPRVVPEIGGWEVATMYRPAGGAQEVEVGGDFFDFLDTAGGWMVLLGDVTGKGVEAATMTSLVRYGGRFLGRGESSPGRLLERLNRALREEPGTPLCTAVCTRLLDDGVVVSAAGHPPPLVLGASGEVREIAAQGPILGAWEDPALSDNCADVRPGEILFLYTDGVIDTRGESGRFGPQRLREALHGHGGTSPADLLGTLGETLEDFERGPQADDTAAVALRRRPG